MSQEPKGTLIAIGWENIRRGAQLYQRRVRPADLCRAMREVGSIFGEVMGGKAFGDWSLRPEDGREFAKHDIVPYQAPRSSSGKDRSVPAILLEVYEWIRDRDDCGTVILGSGDADYQVLVDRARVYGRRIVLCAFSQPVSRDLLSAAPLFPLEAELGIQLAEHGDIDLDVAVAPEENSVSPDDVLGRFIREMHRLESRMNFVGYSMLCSQWMLDWGMAWNERECRRVIDDYLKAGTVDTPRGNQPEQSGLAHVCHSAGPDQRDGAPSLGVQRRARVKTTASATGSPFARDRRRLNHEYATR